MTNSFNPYQSPEAEEFVTPDLVSGDPSGQGGLWRKDRILVMHKSAPLPKRCVKSNVPTERRLTRSLSWHHPLIFALLLLNMLIYILVALATRKTAKIDIGLSDEWFAKRRRAILIAWSIVLCAVLMFGGGIAVLDRSPYFGGMVAGGILLFFVGALYGLISARMVTAVRISKTHVWLKGVCPEFLDGLPDWPHSP